MYFPHFATSSSTLKPFPEQAVITLKGQSPIILLEANKQQAVLRVAHCKRLKIISYTRAMTDES